MVLSDIIESCGGSTELVEDEDGDEIASDSEDTKDHPAESDSEEIP